jgi:RimJ/RimL family protein N-acetyltransferase
MRLGKSDLPMTTSSLHTDRLLLRPYVMADAPELARLAGAREVAATTLRIPHPYSVADAEAFIAEGQNPADGQVAFAIVLRENSVLLGGIGLRVKEQHRHAELGYWIGMPYWGNGYATEAARAVLRYGFDVMKLHRIYASHFFQQCGIGKRFAQDKNETRRPLAAAHFEVGPVPGSRAIRHA